MKKLVVLTLSLMLVATLALSVPLVFAGSNNNNDPHGLQGTNKDSSLLPDASKVPWPAGLVEDNIPPGGPYVVEGCRARGETYLVYVEGIPFPAPGGPCCPSNMIDAGSGLPLPNQCCNPPDSLYDPEDYTPGNHCLCFAMRMFPEEP